jgi:hypothetical protein
MNCKWTKINNVESLDMATTWINFLVFALNVVVIYLFPKVVNVSCDNNVMKLAYIIIVQNFPKSFNKKKFWIFKWQKGFVILICTISSIHIYASMFTIYVRK